MISLSRDRALTPDHPVKHLWQCLRKDVTYHICYDSKQELIEAVADFQSQIKTNHVAKARSPIFEQQP
ncbi:MAG: hypothetical protein QNJ53_16500 [Pleurocapsa sp. MO_192.B19]|nr:hypothetical protein [Pleurocapsa sp. MO_192.B19]